MNERLHIIIMDEKGKMLKLPLETKRLITYLISASVAIVILVTSSLFSYSLFTNNRSLDKKLAELQSKVDSSDEVISEIQQKATTELNELNLQIASLRMDKAEQQAAFKEEKELLISTAVSELEERSVLIETIMHNIGVKVPAPKSSKGSQNSGGPFIEANPGIQDELLYKADKYTKLIKQIPLGSPGTGPITSRFGARQDPFNGKRSVHEGLDFRGKTGDKIYATANGVIKRAFTNGSYGKYVEIDHLNGYTTSFAHMHSFVVRKGDRVQRGQLIGLVGNTGRSTGPHLHYEVKYRGKPVNPIKYIQIANLLKPIEAKRPLVKATKSKIVIK
ncbi:peptidoglycan DD-metalloendopeptidase family protein [Desulfosediminicola ganghwensis]|uniref:peptidoglycan DD-metalloendopeptidase family protein n=1 Tax=Desulfosediminicola ganghwensis TaxID=2569540 RepID=UPI00142EAE41|nr:M23 family metallopeptidase [Desulfosediminicola ganghwensis]